MKKAILSFILFFTFTGYILYTRIVGASIPAVVTTDPSNPKVTLSLPTYSPPEVLVDPKVKTPVEVSPVTPATTTPVTPTPKPPVIISPTPTAPVQTGKYKDGSYKGDSINAYYGNVQVLAVISGGKIKDVQFLDYPKGRQTSVRINERAMPYLTSEAIVAQDSNVDTVSGASFTSSAFRKSLASALVKAKNI